MQDYLVVIDDSGESALALRYAARRAVRTGAGVHVLAIVEPQEFVAWGSAQATIESEARARAEALVASAAGTITQENGIVPTITVREGEAVAVVRDLIGEAGDIGALVLGAAANGNPGPLVTHFAGSELGGLPCPLVIIPGALTRDDIDRLG